MPRERSAEEIYDFRIREAEQLVRVELTRLRRATEGSRPHLVKSARVMVERAKAQLESMKEMKRQHASRQAEAGEGMGAK